MFRSVFSMVALMAAAAPALAQDLKSGPQIGERTPGAFKTEFLNGSQTGFPRCPV